VSSLRLRRLQKKLNTGLKKSVIRRFRTLKKLYNYPKEAEAGLQKLQQPKRSLRVVLWVLVGHLSLQRLLYLLALTRPVAAALQLYISSLYN
jgi:hypothetical protein